MVQAAPETWDEVARHYTRDLLPAERGLAGEIASLLRGSGLPPPGRLIEVGCGSGHLSLLLQQAGYETTLLDFSPVAVDHARGLYAAHGLAGGAREDGRFVLGDAFDLPNLGLGGFDLAWNSGVCEHFDAALLERMLRAMAAVARRVLVVVPNPDSAFYLAGRRRQVERCTWNVGVELLRRNYDEVFRAAGLPDVRRGFVGRDWTRDWIRLAVGEEAAATFEQLLAEGALPPHQSYLQYFLAEVEPDSMRRPDDTPPRPSHPDMDSDAVHRTYYLDSLGTTMVALSKVREEADRLKAEVFAAASARDAARADASRLGAQLARAQEEAQAALAARAEASEHSGELARAREEAAAARREAAEAAAARGEAAAEAAERLARGEQAAQAHRAQLDAAARHIEGIAGLCEELLLRAERAEAERDALLASTSWRITGPLRAAVTGARRLRRGAGGGGAAGPGRTAASP